MKRHTVVSRAAIDHYNAAMFDVELSRSFLLLLVIAAVTLLLASCGDPLPHAPPRVTYGGERLHCVKFQDFFKRTVSPTSYRLFTDHEVRRAGEPNGGVILFRGREVVKNPEFGDDVNGNFVLIRDIEYEYSENCYAVALNSNFGARDAVPGEWESGRKRREDDMRGSKEDATLYEPDGSLRIWNENDKGVVGYENSAAENSVEWRERAYKASGKELHSSALLSQDGRWLAVFSHTSRRKLFKMPSLFPFLGADDGIAGGTMYLDLYDARTGERISAASIPHRDSFDMSVLEEAAWLDDGRYFVMPTNTLARGYLIGTMPD